MILSKRSIFSVLLIFACTIFGADFVRGSGGVHQQFCTAVHNTYRVTGPDGQSHATCMIR